VDVGLAGVFRSTLASLPSCCCSSVGNGPDVPQCGVTEDDARVVHRPLGRTSIVTTSSMPRKRLAVPRQLRRLRSSHQLPQRAHRLETWASFTRRRSQSKGWYLTTPCMLRIGDLRVIALICKRSYLDDSVVVALQSNKLPWTRYLSVRRRQGCILACRRAAEPFIQSSL
jgi:hypothetical protein